ncbi:MAG: MBOAT family protein [Bacteroidetes bacterium]|jgi:alginate O-acetyltransferase complex protein AlgI|nr:MBOAT family protein [Bacteroidota bacterium]MDA0980357.1 MBOAT family protein [Bacteroidota bacterium]|tara:strand:+ start:2602 stop:4050 length:1449 start_codon:yes stop_codon:yes gene_type:complete
MLFNSIDFALFLPVVFVLYWFVFKNSLKYQNLLVVAASYVFYGWWDWRFLGLIIFSTVLDFFIGKSLAKTTHELNRKLLLYTSVAVNLGFLGIFKYFDFFVSNFIDAFSLFGVELSAGSLNIILPVGISFYTFQTLSYSIDVYRRKLKHTDDFIAFSAFVCFFPQLVAGPIERATNLLPQFLKARKFNYDQAADGMRQILWGLFKKVVVADNCAVFVNAIFDNPDPLSGSTLFMGAVLFAFQIYCDFSGYSDIAIGTSRLFNINLKQNFATPYFSRNIGEFWRRWHISLSTWFRDYLYIPLGGSQGGTWNKIRNVFLIFIVSGFWHGASWNFIVWGGLNALYFLPLLLTKNNRNHLNTVAEGSLFPTYKEILSIGLTFFLTVIAWVFFRADTLTEAVHYLNLMFSSSFFTVPSFITPKAFMLYTYLLICLFIAVEWVQRDKKFGLSIENLNRPFRWVIYTIVIGVIITFGQFGESEFIYFQF